MNIPPALSRLRGPLAPWALLAGLAFLVGDSPAQAAPAGANSTEGLARHLPADTIALLSVPDLGRTLNDVRSLPIGKIAAEPSVRDFVEEPLGKLSAAIREQLAEAESGTGMPWIQVYESLGRVRSFEVALTRLGIREAGEDVEGEFGVAARLDTGEAWPAFRAFLEKGLEKAREEGLSVSRESAAGGGSFVRVVREEEGGAGSVLWREEGTEVYVVLASSSTGLVDDLWSRVSRAQSAPSLAADSEFLACTRRCGAGGGAEMRFFLRVAPLLDAIVSGLRIAEEEEEDLPAFLHPQPVDRVLQVLGLRGLRACAFATTAAGDHSVNESYVLAPVPRRGLLGTCDGAPVDRALLRRVPAEATSFSVGRAGLANLWDTFEEALSAIGGEVEKDVRAALDRFEKENGLEVREDLLASLGEEYVSYSLPTKGLMSVPEEAVLVRLVDPDRFERAANALTDALVEMTDVVKLKEKEYEGTNLRSFSITKIPGGESFGGDPNPLAGIQPLLALISPAYAVVKEKDESGAVAGGTFVLSMSATGLRRAIHRLGSEPGEGAIAIEGYGRFASQVPEKVSALSYADHRSEIGAVYAMVTSFVPMIVSAAGKDLPFDLNSLPPGDAITSHLFGSVSYTVADDEGIYSRSFSPFGVDTAGFLAGGIACGAAALVAMRYEAASPPVTYPVPSGQAEDPEEAARRDLRDLKAGIGVYKLERGAYPPSLEALLEKTPDYPDGLLGGRTVVPKDPWGHAYVYEILSSGASYRLRSAGRNGKDEAGEGDDVVGR